ncbi:MAG: fibronectin type III domain-containing protein [Patescibacteria group bacterium]|jgi:hypothetical protein
MTMARFATNVLHVAGLLILSAGASFLFVSHAEAAAISWDSGGANNDWETQENWSGDAVPTGADDVTIDYAETIAINATTTVNSLTIGGTNATTLNFDYDALTGGALIIDSGNLTVAANGTVTHTSGSTSSVLGSIYFDVQTGDADIDGTINADGMGYASGYGTGQGADGDSPGAAGYGGEGGDGTGAAGGSTYGSITAPVDIGSAGGVCWGFTGSAGGGAMKFLVAGTFALDASATLSADGTATNYCTGAGSGGSVYLDVGTLSGSGSISADGGAINRGDNRATGGGGRIAIYFDTDSSTITKTAYAGYSASADKYIGGAGTIYLKDNAELNGDLKIDNNSRDYATYDRKIGKTPLSTATYKTLTISNDGHVDLVTGGTLTVTTLTWAGGNITDNGGILDTVSSGDVVIPAGSYFYANTARSVTSLTVNGTMTHSNNHDAETYKMDFTTSGAAEIASGGKIDVNERGYEIGHGTGGGAGGGAGWCGGGSYGGKGGNGANYAAGATYGSLTAPVNIGSGGGLYTDQGQGAGGGAVKLTVGTTLTMTGTISANGGSVTSIDHNGGGSGGSVYLDIGTISGAGAISADGGSAYNANYAGGGGGRIAIYFDTDSYSSTPTAYGGYDAGSAYLGGAGTIYLKDNAELNGDLLIDNNSQDFTTNDRFLGKTPLTTATYDTLTISNDGHVDLVTGGTLTVTTLTWAGGNITDNGGILDTVSSGDVVIPAGSYFYANTARSVTSLTINGTMAHSDNHDAETYKIDFTTSGTAEIASGGKIDVNERGFEIGHGTGVGAGGGAGWCGGGSYGGQGSNGNNYARGATYGSLTAPVNIGSGGGLFTDQGQGAGGGAVKLTVGTTLTMTGTISANGGSVSTIDYNGGGSGGAVYLDAATISGAGAISADGGSAYNANYAAGGGGRIAIYYDTDSYSATPTAYGGYDAGSAYLGGAGTIYLKDNAVTYGDLLIDNNSSDSINDYYFGKTPIASGTFNSITISDDGHLPLESGVTLTTTTLTWTGGNISDNGGTLATVTSGNVVIPTSAKLLANTTRSVTTLTINGSIAHSKNLTIETYKINYTTSGNVVIGASGSINIDGLGFSGGYGDGHGHEVGTYGSGGGYGGRGGNTADGGDTGGATYGSSTEPSNIGSGGMGQEASNRGSSGGGAVKITCGGDFSIGGAISSNGGSDYVGYWADYGGGSGGSIWLAITGVVSGSANVSANGSSGQNGNSGAGGGGRIAIISGSSTWSGSTSVSTGALGRAGEAGTVLVNVAPTAAGTTGTFATDGTGKVTISTIIDDAEDAVSQFKVEYSMDGGSNWEDPTLSESPSDITSTYGTPVVENDDVYQVSSVTTVSGANTVTIIWDSQTDEPSGNVSNAQIRVTAYDGSASGPPDVSSNFKIDNVHPASLASLAVTAYPSSSMTLTWTAATDTNFDHYELWYGTNSSDVDNRTGTAAEWDNSDDAALATATTSTTTITGLTPDTTYYVKIWAIDDYSNDTTIASTSQKTNGLPTAASITPTFSTSGDGEATVTVIIDDADDNTSSFKVEYSINGGGAWADPTLSTAPADLSATYGAPTVNNASLYQIDAVTTASGANTVSFVWDSAADVPTADIANAQIRVTPYDGSEAGAVPSSSNFTMDNVDPVGLAGFAVDSYSSASLVLDWTAATDTNFDHYELWYGTNSSDVDNRTGTAAEWDNSDDAALTTATTASTTITGLTENTTYYTHVWAADDFGNESTLAATSQKTNAKPTATTPTATVATDGTGRATVATTIDDTDDEASRFLVEYSVNGGGAWAKAILSETDLDTTATYNDPDVANINSYQVGNASGYVTTVSGANTVTFIWNSMTDAPTADVSNAKIRITSNDQIENGTAVASANFTLDNAAPASLAGFDDSIRLPTAITFTWTAATDSHFDHYEIWYGENASDVDNRTGTATEWDNSDDATLATATTATTTITSLLASKTYYAKTWAIDTYTNETTLAAATAMTPSSKTSSTTSRPKVTPEITNLFVAQDDGRTVDTLYENKWTTVTWLTLGAVPYVYVSYSTDNGSTWQTIVGPIANRDNIAFTMPVDIGDTFMIKVDGTDLALILDSSVSSLATIGTLAVTETPVVEAPPMTYKPVEPVYPTQPVLGYRLPTTLMPTPTETTTVVQTPLEDGSESSPMITYTDPNGPSPVTGEQEDISEVFPGEYIKSPSFPTVYYVTDDLERRPFMDAQTYFTYENSFDMVKVVTDATLPLLNLAGPMLPKPSTVLVKIQSDPKVYVVTRNPDNEYRPILRWLSSESLAIDLYGEQWAEYIIDIPVTLFARFEIGNALGIMEYQGY